MKLFPTRHPERLDAEHPILVEEFLELSGAGKTVALMQLVQLVSDFSVKGRASPYLRSGN